MSHTCLGLEWRSRQCFEERHQPWRVHNHRNQSIFCPLIINISTGVTSTFVEQNTRLANLLNFGEHVLMCWELSIKHKQFLLLLRHRLSSRVVALSANPSIGQSNVLLCLELKWPTFMSTFFLCAGSILQLSTNETESAKYGLVGYYGWARSSSGLSHQTEGGCGVDSFYFLNCHGYS
jgi:hypothetical protein